MRTGSCAPSGMPCPPLPLLLLMGCFSPVVPCWAEFLVMSLSRTCPTTMSEALTFSVPHRGSQVWGPQGLRVPDLGASRVEGSPGFGGSGIWGLQGSGGPRFGGLNRRGGPGVWGSPVFGDAGLGELQGWGGSQILGLPCLGVLDLGVPWLGVAGVWKSRVWELPGLGVTTLRIHRSGAIEVVSS